MTVLADLAHIPNETRQSSLSHGLGLTQLLKPVQPAAGANFTRAVPGEFFERYLALAFQLVTAVAAGNRSLAINYLDGDGFIFNQTPVALAIPPSTTMNVYADLVATTPVQQPVTQQASGSVLNPAAGGTIVTLTLPPGDWQLAWEVEIEGTTSATDDNNLAIFQGATQLAPSENGHVVGQPYTQETLEVNAGPAGATITVKATVLATVGATYLAQIVATPLSQLGVQAVIPDVLFRSGWQLQVAVGNIQAGDQISGIGLLTERYPSDTAVGHMHSQLPPIYRALAAAIGG